MKKAAQATDRNQGRDAAIATKDCRSCTHFEVGLDGSPYEGYVRCVFDEMERDPDRAAVDPDRFGRKAMIPDSSRRKNGGLMPDWIRADCAVQGSADECAHFRFAKPAKPYRRRNADFGWVETWIDAAKAFSEATGLELGTPPLDDEGEAYPSPLAWDGRCEELTNFLQRDFSVHVIFSLLPYIRFIGPEDRRFVRKNIGNLKKSVWKFLRAVAVPGRVNEKLPDGMSPEDVAALFKRTDIKPGTPEEDAFWNDVLGSGKQATTGPDAWTPTIEFFEAVSTILSLEPPPTESHRPVDDRTILRGLFVADLRAQIKKADGKPLSYTEIALLVVALNIDFGPSTTLAKFAQRVRGFESAAIREAGKLAEKRRASMPEVDISASE